MKKMKIIFFLFAFAIQIFSQSSCLKIITINTWCGLDFQGTIKMGEYETPERKEARFDVLLEQLRALKPDVIFLQEANPVGKYSARLADSLDFNEIHQVYNAGIKFGSIGIPSNLKYGNTILANKKFKLEFFDVWKLGGSFGIFGDPLTIHFSESDFALVGKILIDNTPIYLVNVHLIAAVPADSILKYEFKSFCKKYSIDEDEKKDIYRNWDSNILKRNDELESLNEQLKKIPYDFPFIMGGDFNTEPQIKELKNLIGSNNLIDTFIKNNSSKYYTWNPETNENVSYSTIKVDAGGNKLSGYDLLSTIYDSHPRRIDYIFLSDNFKKDDILSYKIILDSVKNNIHLSDHYGVYSNIDLKRIINSVPKEIDKVIPLKDHTIEPLPIISYDTDVGFGYGAKAFFLNLLNNDESFDVTLFNSTKGERWYRFVFSLPDFELRQGKVYPAAVDFTIDYDKYINNNFFGTGNKSNYNEMEVYTKEPLEISLNLSRGFTKNLIGQFGLKYQMIRNYNYSDTSKLLEQPSSLSSSKVNSSSLNISLRYDTRNSFVNPSNGVVLEGETEFAPRISFCNTSYARYGGWFQYYTTLFYPKTILAFRAGLQALTGNNLPVQVLLPIGGNNTLRGYPQDRFLDRTSALLNAVLRFPIFWRFGGILGMDAGKVWNSIGKMDIRNWANNPVFGLRFYMDTFVIRLDVGISKETTGFYLNFGQIF